MERPLVYYAISVFVGCVFCLLIFENSIILGVVVSASFFIIMFFTVDKRFLIIIFAFFFLGVISFKLYFQIKVYEGQTVRVIQKSLYYSVGEYKGRKIRLKGNLKDINEGQRLRIYGSFQGELDFQRGVVGNFKIKKYEVLKNDYMYNLYDMKRVVYEKLVKFLPEDRTALVMALGYGETQYLSNTQKNEFQIMGVVHAVSVSGFHMALIYKILEKTLGIKIAIAASFLYLIFTGLQAATIRAFIMILIFKLSHMFLKDYDGISSLSMSALLILIIKPYYALDMGFMLSFSATLGILIYYKKISKLFYKMPKILNESISVSLSSQIFSVPYIAFTIQSFSTGFMLGNIMLMPLYSMVVVLSCMILVFIKIDFMVKLLSGILSLILNSIEGANYFILKICPPVSFLGYLEGILLVLMYISYLLYKYKDNRFKYAPFFILIMFFIKDYSFIPQIYHVNLYKGQAIIVRYNNQKVMICSYENEGARSIISLKEKMKINKIITNPKHSIEFRVNNDLKGSVCMQDSASVMNLFCGENNFNIKFFQKNISNKMEPIESGSFYVIMFNRVIRID